ncbi:MAG: STAS/SEC14 domain-containing protein [Labilibaculum sp.]|nr:STAS/SEC14 domain-containing protein [Labilibaculum sp.]MBI9058186.1 STAS/SEC14 domain-containing protein [Labilibaculum sp.]
MKFVKYSFWDEHKLLIKACRGEVIRRELINEFQQVFANLKSNKPVNVLVDVTKLKLKASVAESELYTAFFQKDKIYNLVDKIAVVTNTPDQVVQTILFMEGIQHLDTDIKIFSSVDSAAIWLNTNARTKDIKETLMNLTEIESPKNT